MKGNWKFCRLGDVCRVIPGYAFSSRDWCTEGVPIVKIKNIKSDCTVDIKEVDYVPESLLTPKLEKYVLKDNDIIIAMTGATAGKVGKIRVSGPVLLNQRVAKIEAVDVEPGYIWAITSSQEYQNKFFYLADGAAQPNMSGSQIEGVEVPLPPAHIRRKIVAIFSAYDDLIENNTGRVVILDEMSRSLYREWFVNFRFPGHEKVEMVDSPLGKIPEGWNVCNLGEISLNFDRLRKPLSSMERQHRKGIYPYYGAAKIFDYIDEYIFDGTYLLMAEDGSVITPDQHPVLQYATGRFWANNHTHILKGASPVSTEFLYFALRDFNISGLITGAAQPKITQANLNRIQILVPDEALLGKFNNIALDFQNKVVLLQKKNEILGKTRDLLLPKLISGEIDVSKFAEEDMEVTA